MTLEIKQFKLANDEEIVCQVIEWPTPEEPSMVIRRPMKVISMENYREGARYYAFRPWLMFQEHKDNMQILNSMHIVVEASPSEYLTTQYNKFLEEMDKVTESDRKSITRTTLSELDEKTRQSVLKELRNELKEVEKLMEKAKTEENELKGKIIHFPDNPKGRLH